MATPTAPVARRVVVRGRVQGVFFRSSCRDLARRLGLCGWVRNTAAATVEIWVEAHRPRSTSWCDGVVEGPDQAEVVGLDVHETPTGAEAFHLR